MAIAITTGEPWCNLPTMQGKVVFASREDSYEDIVSRVQAKLSQMGKKRKAAENAICRNLAILGRDETSGAVLTHKKYGACGVAHDVVDFISEQCQGAVLVVLETASRLHGGDELNEDLAVLADAFERIAARTGAAVVLIRHVSKEAARNKTVDSYSGRGGGALADAARSVLVLTQLDPQQARSQGIALDALAHAIKSPVLALHHAKASYSAANAPLYFVRLPGPVLKHIDVPEPSETFGESLLAYLKETCEAMGAGVSAHRIKQASEIHGVPQRRVAETLTGLLRDGRVKAEEVKSRGGTHTVWYPSE